MPTIPVFKAANIPASPVLATCKDAVFYSASTSGSANVFVQDLWTWLNLHFAVLYRQLLCLQCSAGLYNDEAACGLIDTAYYHT